MYIVLGFFHLHSTSIAVARPIGLADGARLADTALLIAIPYHHVHCPLRVQKYRKEILHQRDEYRRRVGCTVTDMRKRDRDRVTEGHDHFLKFTVGPLGYEETVRSFPWALPESRLRSV